MKMLIKRTVNVKNIIKGALIPDKRYSKIRFKNTFGKSLNLKNPKTFNEKIQWLKLYNRKSIYSIYADKYKVRDIVKNKINENILNELYGVYDNPNDINFDMLPSSFVLKATHGSGTNIICYDKATLNKKKVIKEIKSWLTTSYYLMGREWPYKDVPRKVICEKLLVPENDDQLFDFKFFCFNGKVKFIQVDVDRFNHHKRVFYNVNWEKQPFTIFYPIFEGKIKRPNQLQEMIRYAELLSEGEPFLRVDFYNFDDKVVFGEITMYPENGYGKFYPNEYDKLLGEMILLPQEK